MKRVLLGLILSLFPHFVYAASVEVTDYLVDATILENGDVRVRELVVADGTFNYFERDLFYQNSALVDGDSLANNAIYNATDISDVTIKAKEVDAVSFDTFSDTDFTFFQEVSFGNNGDSNLYTVTRLNNGYRFRMYLSTNQEKVAFYIEYTIEDAIVMHEDVAELYWTFVPDGFEDTLGNIQIHVALPSEDQSNLFRFWAHGNLDGNIEKLGNSGVSATISEVLPGESVDIRLTFNPILVNEEEIYKHSYINALDSIIAVETERADVANQLRDDLILKRNIAVWGSWILIGSILLLGVFIYFKYGKSPKASYYSKYNREFIDDYNVEVIDYLMKRKITPNALSASIMNLIYKKNISAKEISSTKKDKEYEFTLLNTKKLNDSEILLVEFLFDTVGKEKVNEESKKTFTTKDLKSYASGTKTCNTFIKSYTAWKNSVLQKGIDEKFFEISGVPKIIGVIILVVAIFLLMFIVNNKIDYIPSYIAILLAVIFFIYTLVVYKKTIKGSEHYARWNAFKNFLDDFGSFELKELPEIILWERYLVYATIFGLAEKVQKSMNVYISEMNLSEIDTPAFFYIHIGPVINSSVNQAVTNAYNRQAANYANTHSNRSSGGGFGGGFSSGGGFGGGGGGGRFG